MPTLDLSEIDHRVATSAGTPVFKKPFAGLCRPSSFN